MVTMNDALLISLQRGIVKELCLKGLLTEEQENLVIEELEQINEKNIIEKEVDKNEKSSSIL